MKSFISFTLTLACLVGCQSQIPDDHEDAVDVQDGTDNTPSDTPGVTPDDLPATATSALEGCPFSVMSAFTLANISPTPSGSNRYRVPTSAELVTARDAVGALLNGDGKGAVTEAAKLQYSVCQGTGADDGLVLFRPLVKDGQAVFVIRTKNARAHILETPHPIFDSNTLSESVVLFERMRSRALIVSGTHRCANKASSGCSGTTNACGSSSAFRVSDMAHTEQSIFHAVHSVLVSRFAQDWILAIHGMGDAGVSVSDGTSLATTADSPSARITAALAKRFSNVTTCNAFGSFPRLSRMCGTTDAQGRLVNGSHKACNTEAPRSAKRFIHIEQSKDVRLKPELVAEVLTSVVP